MPEPLSLDISSLEEQIAELRGELRSLEKKIAVLRRELRSARLPDEQRDVRETALRNAEEALWFFRKTLEFGPIARV